jgi:hypothetical protein
MAFSCVKVFSSSQIPSPNSKYRFNMLYGKKENLTMTYEHIITAMPCLSMEVQREFIKMVQTQNIP